MTKVVKSAEQRVDYQRIYREITVCRPIRTSTCLRYFRTLDGFGPRGPCGLAYGTIAGDRGTHHPELLGPQTIPGGEGNEKRDSRARVLGYPCPLLRRLKIDPQYASTGTGLRSQILESPLQIGFKMREPFWGWIRMEQRVHIYAISAPPIRSSDSTSALVGVSLAWYVMSFRILGEALRTNCTSLKRAS